MKKITLLLIAMLIVTVSCQPPPTPTSVPTPVPLTPTAIPSAPTPIPSAPTALPSMPTQTTTPLTPTAISPTSNLEPNASAILTLTAPKAQYSAPRSLPQATIRVGDFDRTYLYYAPANLPRNAPLLFVLHGSSMNGTMMRLTTDGEFEKLADQNGFVVVYPNGYGNSWNSCNKGAALTANNADDVGFIRALIAKFRADYGIDSSRVFETGYSSGGHMGYRLALEIPDEIAAIAAIGASLATDETNDCRISGKPMPVLIMNGTSDPIAPFGGGITISGATVRSTQATAEYFAKLNGQTTPKTTRLSHRNPSDPTTVDRTVWNDAGKPEVVLITVNGGGHVVPLGKFSTAIFLGGMNLGQATGDLDGPAEIWEFFARQRSLK